MNDLISVIINVYNGEKYIKKCLDSVVNQTYKNLEIIIVNDKSNDKTLDIVKSYKDKRIKIINNKKNMGLSLSRNVGIDNSNGRYLYFVDVDDFIELDAIEYLYKLIKKYKVRLATCRCLDIYDYNYKYENDTESIVLLSKEEMLDRVLLTIDRSGTTWNKLFDKDLFKNIRFENRIINDVVTTYKLVLECKEIVFSNQIKYFYLRHKDSILGKKNPKHSIDLYDAAIERYNYIDKLYPEKIENKICLLLLIESLYVMNNDEVTKHLKEKDALKLYKELYTSKIFKTNIKFNNKIKILLFRISPRLYNFIIKIYLKIKNR
jgi:glycosyltransferase involved in cell wall biosynthesis